MVKQTIKSAQAQEIILDFAKKLEFEEKDLLSALSYVIEEDVLAEENIPPFDNSAMDGFALRAEDTKGASRENPRRLEIIDEQPAGSYSRQKVVSGTAMKIMTGAAIPQGADAVIPVEKTASTSKFVEVLESVPKSDNIRPAGEDLPQGKIAAKAGTVLGAAEIGLLASLGKPSVKVVRKPQVAIIATGDELISVDSPLTEGKIRDSNSYTIYSQVLACGAIPERLGVAGDTKEKVEKKIIKGLHSDVVITSGGVSVGEYDVVRDVLETLGAKEKFWGVAQKPGKPLTFWVLKNKLIFGLPGNPVASMVCFEEYVRPALLRMMGREHIFRPVVKGILTHDLKKKAGRMNFMRVQVEKRNQDYYVTSTGSQGSGILSSMSRANGIALLSEETTSVRKGEKVSIQLIGFPEEY